MITNNPYDQTLKLKLREFRGGIPYQYLLRSVYPKLRVAICKVNYEVKNFKVDEAREVFKKRPQNLSLNEMFLVANSYPENSLEFLEVLRLLPVCIRKMKWRVSMLLLHPFHVMIWFQRKDI